MWGVVKTSSPYSIHLSSWRTIVMAKKKKEKKGAVMAKAAKSLLGDVLGMAGPGAAKDGPTRVAIELDMSPPKKKRKGSRGLSAREAEMFADPTPGSGIPPAEFIRMMAGGYKKRRPTIKRAVESGEMEPLARYEHGRGGGPEEGNIVFGERDSKYNLDPKLRKHMAEKYRQPSHAKKMTPYSDKDRVEYPYGAKHSDRIIAYWKEREDEDDEKRTKWHKKHTDKGKDTSKAKGRAPKG
tara:strand:- start:774 stop:1490 length:717 start_codon:yes stop_codon:yes gene_type:complete